MPQPGAAEVTISGLPSANHNIRVEKVTESVWVLGSFDGLYVPKSAKIAAPLQKARQIEFIGDSDMTGYGIRSTTTICTEDVVRLVSETQIAYPALLGKMTSADYQINAISGRGLVRH